MKVIGLSILLVTLLCATKTDTYTGVITDTMCGAKHNMMKNQPDAQCIKMCVKGQYVYALYDGTDVIRLSDQKTPAKYGGQKVKVTGTYDAKTKTIKVSAIEPVTGN